MKPVDRNAFIAWHNERVEENYVFDLEKERYEYCVSDVDILSRGMIKLREEFLETCNADPLQYVTLPSLCFSIFRSKFIQHKTIAVFTKDKPDKHSKTSLIWLNSLENPNIQHALNGNCEVRICGCKVDGYDATTRTCYEFNGCLFHGCPHCYAPESINPFNKQNMSDLYHKTCTKKQKLEDGGYKVISEWECNFVKSLAYKKFKDSVPCLPKFNYRSPQLRRKSNM